MKSEDRSLILAKLETEYNTDPTPAAATNAIEVFDMATHSLEAKQNERKVAAPWGGMRKPLNIATAQKISFKVFCKGSGALGTVPVISPLLRSCRLTETISAGTSVAYERHSDATEESCTIYYYEDGILKKMTGCIGTVKAGWAVNEDLVLDLEFTGMYKSNFISDVALPNPTFETTDPLVFNTAAFTYGTYDLIVTKLDWDLAHEVKQRQDANQSNGVHSIYSKNNAAPTCAFDPEMEAVADFDPYTLAANSTENDLSVLLGAVDGNKVQLELFNVVPQFPSTGSRDGIKTYEINCTCHVTNTAGNNEFKLTFL